MSSKIIFLFILILFSSFSGTKMVTQNTSDFKIKLQISDDGFHGNRAGEVVETRWASDLSSWSDWAIDGDCYDPDAIKIGIEANTDEENVLQDLDVRLGIQLMDGCGKDFGTIQYTPWASESGGWSAWAVDSDAYDFDGARIKIETRTKKGLIIRDTRIGLHLSDKGGGKDFGQPRYTPWLIKEGGGWTEWTADNDGYDPDGVRIGLEARVPK